MVLKRVEAPSHFPAMVDTIRPYPETPDEFLDVHVLVKGINEYTFREVPEDRTLVSVEVFIPDDRYHLKFKTPVKEGRNLYKFLLSRGYRPW